MATGEIFEDPLGGDDIRIEVFSDTQSLMLKKCDLIVRPAS